MELEIKRFGSPDETRTFEKGTFEVVQIGGRSREVRARLEMVGARRCDHRDRVVRGRTSVWWSQGAPRVRCTTAVSS